MRIPEDARQSLLLLLLFLMKATFTTNYTFTPLAVFIVLSIGMLPWKTKSNPLWK
jgi:hypothetical protein